MSNFHFIKNVNIMNLCQLQLLYVSITISSPKVKLTPHLHPVCCTPQYLEA